jgi:hypothetical protein
MNKNDIETRMQLTAALCILPAGDTGYINVGDLTGRKRTLERKGADVLVQEKGFHRKLRNLTSEVGVMYEFKLREQTKLNLPMLLAALGSPLSAVQTIINAPTGTATFNGAVQGRSYMIGNNALNNVVVKVGGVAKTVDVDYSVDLGSGELYVIPGAPGINNGDNLAVTFGAAAIDGFDVFSSGALSDAGQKTGTVKLLEFDQHAAGGTPRRMRTFTAQYWCEGDEDHDGTKPAELVLKVLVTDKPTVQVLK